MKRFLSWILLVGFGPSIFAQTLRFEAFFDLPVTTATQTLAMPWVGGLNACLLGSLDLNGDGIDDLVVYDKMGPRLLTFVTETTLPQRSFRYAPQYESLFPPIEAWFLLRDYNGDGRPDLFTFNGVAGIRVYKNSSRNGTLSFEPTYNPLKAKIYQSYETLYCPSVDYPALYDIDGDGDLDLLTFWLPSAGNRLFYYKNHSMEKNGHADSLDLILEDRAWGCFEESDESNGIRLHICEESQNTPPSTPFESAENPPIPKHTGSSVFVQDVDHDGLADLFLGDFGFPNLMLLHNGGSPQKALITHYDSLFPRLSTPIKLYNCPALSCLDLDGDQQKELVFSPFNSLDFGIAGDQSLWVYRDMGQGDYQLCEKDFLQSRMLDFGLSAYPVFADMDGDGLTDLLVGNYGIVDTTFWETGAWHVKHRAQLHYFRNTGTAQKAAFTLIDEDLGGLGALKLQGLCPTTGDLDGDGKLEILVGSADGQLLLLRQSENAPFRLSDTLPFNLGTFLAPTLFDLNNDGLLDLIVGEKQRIWTGENGQRYFKGNLNYLQNEGTAQNPQWRWITDSLGGVDLVDPSLSNFGYAKPLFYRDTAQQIRLLCGREAGTLQQYLVPSAEARFVDLGPVKRQETGEALKIGRHSAPALADLNGDGVPDLILGNIGGGLLLFKGYASADSPTKPQQTTPKQPLEIWPNPAKDHLNYQTTMPQGTYEIRGSDGRLHQQNSATQQGCIDISKLKPGTYIFSRIENSESASRSFVVL